MKKVFLILMLFLLFLSCKNKNNNTSTSVKNNQNKYLEVKDSNTHKGIGVVNVNRLRFRAENDLRSKTLRYLDQGTIVEIVKKDSTRVKIGDMEDYWYKIFYDGITGWVFGYFIDVYSSYETAKLGAKKYLFNSNDSENASYDEDGIDGNLFYISEGKLYQVMSASEKLVKELPTIKNKIIKTYFILNNPDTIYYIAGSKKDITTNGNLYKYDLQNETNELITKSILYANFDDSLGILLSLEREKNKLHWEISTINFLDNNKIKKVSSIEVKDENQYLNTDIFSNTLFREQGGMVTLKKAEDGEYIYLKTPENTLTYLISLVTGDTILVNMEQKSGYAIDSSRFFVVNNHEDSTGKIVYNIILKDRYTGMEKAIFRSHLFPNRFIISPGMKYVAISMIDMERENGNYYDSHIYVLSLSTYSIFEVSTNPFSYQPKWKSKKLY